MRGTALVEKLDASLKLCSVTFSDGTVIETKNIDLMVLVGPNNSGKSECLRDIQRLSSGGSKTVVISSAEFERTGDVESIRCLLDRRFSSLHQNGDTLYSFWGVQIWEQSIDNQWSNQLGDLSKLFVSHLSTDERLSDSNPVKAVNFRKGAVSHPIHIMQYDTDVEDRTSEQFQRAFGVDLLVDRFGGSDVGLLAGERPKKALGEDRVDASYRDKVDAVTNALEKQGDGMRAFATIVSRVLAIDTATMILIDEPEAFLHPPQVKMLGEFLASSIPEGRQVFVATHSRDFLMGAVASKRRKTLIARMIRDGDINRPHILDQGLAVDMSKDAVMRHSSVLDGVFHERVILCEADADCMFYSAVLQVLVGAKQKLPDVLFAQSGGKHKMPLILRSLTGLRVPTDVIIDIDALNDENFFRNLFEQTGGTWTDIQSAFKQVCESVNAIHGVTKTLDLQKYFTEKIVPQDPGSRIGREHRSNLNAIFVDASPWGRLKRAGVAELPNGQPTQSFEQLYQQCSNVGIWLVRVGELEGFCKSVGNKGQRWAQEVIESKDLARDSELSAAREFINAVWRQTDKPV
jgi:energy-coupling factor transporter ATP-binding protein EcfA2